MTAPHRAVAAVLAEMPVGRDGEVLTGWHVQRDQRGEDLSVPTYGNPEPLAAKYAAAFARWMAANCPSNTGRPNTDDGLWFEDQLRALADEIAASVQP